MGLLGLVGCGSQVAAPAVGGLQDRVDLPGGAGVVRTSGRLVLLPPGTTGRAVPDRESPTSEEFDA